jgi:hypothetical protein
LDVNPSHELRQKIISLLVKLAAVSQELPPSLFLEGVDLCGVRDPILMGGFADVFRGRYQEHEVAIKRLRVTSSADKAVIYPVSGNDFHFPCPFSNSKGGDRNFAEKPLFGGSYETLIFYLF